MVDIDTRVFSGRCMWRVSHGLANLEGLMMHERDYEKEPVWKLWMLWSWSIVTGSDEWQRINKAIENKTGSGRPPKRRWY